MNSYTRLAAATCVAALLASCSTIGSDEPEGGSGESKNVTVMTHDSFTLTDDQIAAFTEQTGYTLRTTAPGDGGVVLNQLILTKDNPAADAVFGIDTANAQRAISEGVLSPVTIELPESAQQYAVEDKLIPIDKGDVCINIDHAYFEDHGLAEPTSMDDLTKPEYAKLLVVTNPATSSPGLAFLEATIAHAGEDGWKDYWTALDDGGMRVAEGWSDAYYTDFSGSDGEGPYPLALSYSSSPAAEVGEDGSAPSTGFIESTCIRQVEYAGVIEGGSNPEGARAFIEFILSEDIQASIPGQMYMYPIDDSVQLPDEWAAYAQLTDEPLALPEDLAGADRQAWVAEWTSHMGR